MRKISVPVALFLLLPIGSTVAAPEPKTFADCEKQYNEGLKKSAIQTAGDLRQSQHIAGLARLSCEKIVNQKNFDKRATKKPK